MCPRVQVHRFQAPNERPTNIQTKPANHTQTNKPEFRMKTHKLRNFALMFPLLATLAIPILKANAVTNTWTGASTLTDLWSDINNWSLPQLPTASDDVIFTNVIGCTNVLGAVNNVVDRDWAVNSLGYM